MVFSGAGEESSYCLFPVLLLVPFQIPFPMTLLNHMPHVMELIFWLLPSVLQLTHWDFCGDTVCTRPRGGQQAPEATSCGASDDEGLRRDREACVQPACSSESLEWSTNPLLPLLYRHTDLSAQLPTVLISQS